MGASSTRGTSLLLVALVILDLVLSSVCLFRPDVWFKIFHGVAYVDPQGLLRRTGAVWAAFTLLQSIALLRWRRCPHWLVLVAGVRLTEIFSDWTYLLFASEMTATGGLGLFVSPLANVFFGLFLLKKWRQIAGPGAGVGNAAGKSAQT